jgi:hemolysin activation/secretion protein
MVRRSSICVACLSAIVVLASTEALGQNPPAGAQPGQIERQFQRPPEPSARPGPITIPNAGQKPPQNADSIKFVLDRLTIDGLTVYRPEVLAAAYANLLHKEITLADIYRLVERLTAEYRNDGYVLSQVFVPVQTVEEGAVRLQVVEGYVANVRVEGGSAAVRERAERYAEKIRASRPLTMAALERYVLLVNDLPGVSAHAVLAPSAVPGASDLILQVSNEPLFADLSGDNRGGHAQGPGRAQADVGVNSITGVGSRTELRGVTTFNRELSYVAAAHDQFVGSEGGKFAVVASYVYSRPKELTIIPLHLTTSSGMASLSYSHPLVRRRSHNLYLHGAFSTFDGTIKVFGVNDTIDHLRALSAGVTYDSADALGGINIVDFGFAQGLRGLGASSNGERLLSRATGRVDFRKSTLYAQRLQPLTSGWSVLVGLDAQYAFTDLLAPEMFSVGGEFFGRGYDPSALLNDHGAAVKLDLRYSHTWGGQTPIGLMPYVFGDLGRVWQRTRVPGLPASESAASAGGGLRLTIGNRYSTFIEVAKPFDRIEGQSRDARVFAGASVR